MQVKLLLATAPDAIKFTANEREQSLFYVKYNLKDEVLGTDDRMETGWF